MLTYNDTQFVQEITYWEKVADTRWGGYITDIEKCAILKANDLSGTPARALEIGCEGGRWSKLLTDLGWKMICTDIDEQTLSICKKRIPTADCILVSQNESTIPFASGSVSLLLCIEVTPVIQANWFINEGFRVLQNEGLIVGVFLNLLSFRGLYGHLRASLRGTFDCHKMVYPFWRRKLSKRGFVMLYEEGCSWFPFRRASNSIFVPYFTRLEKGLGLRKLTAVSPWIVFIAQKIC